MKPRKQKCSNCGGRGTKLPETKFGWEGRLQTYNQFARDCPSCEGTGEEILISPKQWEEYQMMKSRWKELNGINQLYKIRAGFILKDLKGKPLDAISNNQGKIDIK